ncbi:sterol O-acyltransferase 1-like isoform X2 [Corticium candelabrum]|uniref:sterol O-acyltransferase 1-like isoform X2 n=1 Tax=Corticium candelabrum TaxID=121492 RepID=UPI002E252C1A|nr:sterol O-acyltransferase 1-like isoform X2 [Corticium candelabrum]
MASSTWLSGAKDGSRMYGEYPSARRWLLKVPDNILITPSKSSWMTQETMMYWMSRIWGNTEDNKMPTCSWLVLDFSHIGWAFGQFPLVITLWMVMQAQALLAFPAFQMWTLTRSESRLRIAVIDLLWLLAYILFQITFIIYPVMAVYSWELPLASTIVVTCEQVRFLMKVHAFVRENAVKVVCPASQDLPKGNTLELPGFSKYLYFLFVPTLIYRDTYPRTNVIRWKYVVTNFAQVVACLFYTYYIFARFLVPVFHNVGREPLSLRNLTLLTFSSMVPGMMILILGFFCILHSWMNAFAEMMRFADREFYQDWWNSRQFARFYRTWNVIVHEWLYYYVFRDTMRLCQNSHRKEAIARVTVFVLSAVVHEYVIAAMLRFFYPIMMIMFGGVGFSFIWLTKNREYRVWNVFMWVMLFMGCGMLMTLYTHEWYVRRNCPLYDDFWANYFVPRTWTCNYASPM